MIRGYWLSLLVVILGSLVVISFPEAPYGPDAEFKEFKPRLEFETRLKHGWFQLKLYSVFRDLSRFSIGTGFWRFSDAIKFCKFGL